MHDEFYCGTTGMALAKESTVLRTRLLVDRRSRTSKSSDNEAFGWSIQRRTSIFFNNIIYIGAVISFVNTSMLLQPGATSCGNQWHQQSDQVHPTSHCSEHQTPNCSGRKQVPKPC